MLDQKVDPRVILKCTDQLCAEREVDLNHDLLMLTQERGIYALRNHLPVVYGQTMQFPARISNQEDLAIESWANMHHWGHVVKLYLGVL
jgi:hypothetical protein